MPIAAGAGGGPHRKGGKSLCGCDHGRAAAAADHGLRLGRWNEIEGMKRRPLNDGKRLVTSALRLTRRGCHHPTFRFWRQRHLFRSVTRPCTDRNIERSASCAAKRAGHHTAPC
jgi:hypothetical protein